MFQCSSECSNFTAECECSFSSLLPACALSTVSLLLTFIGVRECVRIAHVAQVEDERAVGTAEVLLALALQRAQRVHVCLHLLPREAQSAAVDTLVATHIVEVNVPASIKHSSQYTGVQATTASSIPDNS